MVTTCCVKSRSVIVFLCMFYFGMFVDRILLLWTRRSYAFPQDVVTTTSFNGPPVEEHDDGDRASSHNVSFADVDVVSGSAHLRNTNSSNNPSSDSNVVFFHVHMVKTAGSTLNRLIARKYYAVCGHKGYSFDQPLRVDEPRIGPDGWGPDQVDFGVMDKRGWHNCMFISHESWSDLTVRIMTYLKGLGLRIHALVPCRDPVSHCLSKLSHGRFPLGKWSKLGDKAFCGMVSRCRMQEERFSVDILRAADETTFFWYKNLTFVDGLVSDILPHRAFELEDGEKTYVTNEPYPESVVRDVVRRCGRRVHKSLMKEEYYQQCSRFVPEVDHIPFS